VKQHKNDYARRVRAGGLKDSKEKLEYLDLFRAVLSENAAEQKRAQVSAILCHLNAKSAREGVVSAAVLI